MLERAAFRCLCILFPVFSALVPCTALAQPLTCGQVINETIAAPLEQDQFTFDGEQGDVVTFTLVQTGAIDPGFLVAAEVLYPPVPSFGSRFFAQVRNVVLPFTGTYTVRVLDNGNTDRGSYSLRIGWLSPLQKQCADRTALVCGQVVNGSIATPLEQDLFSFAGEAGTTVTFTLVQTGAVDAGFQIAGEVLHPPVPSFRTAFFAQVRNVTLPLTGTYVVRLLDFRHARRGTYSLRFGSVGPCPSSPPPSPPSGQAPGPPINLTASVTGSTVTLDWGPPSSGGTIIAYVVEAGSSPGDSSVTVFDTGSSATTLTAVSVPLGAYFVRLKARNSSGVSPPSNEVVVLVGGGPAGCVAAPTAPTNVTATVSGQLVTLAWRASASAVTSYIIEAGSFSGGIDIAQFATGNASTSLAAVASQGTYFVRVRARNACGASGASNEVIVTVP
jgi:hypothetical protein